MNFDGALIREQGVEFAVIIVKKYVIDNRLEANKTIQMFQSIFTGIPIILMAQDFRGIPSYYGRDDIVKFLASIPIETIPWKKYTIY
jgi:hypothetical protein